MLSNVVLDVLLKTGDRVQLVVAGIFFSQAFENTAEELVKIRCRYVCRLGVKEEITILKLVLSF